MNLSEQEAHFWTFDMFAENKDHHPLIKYYCMSQTKTPEKHDMREINKKILFGTLREMKCLVGNLPPCERKKKYISEAESWEYIWMPRPNKEKLAKASISVSHIGSLSLVG